MIRSLYAIGVDDVDGLTTQSKSYCGDGRGAKLTLGRGTIS